MHMYFRTMLHFFLARFGPRLGHGDVARTNFVTLPTDLDVLNHMNNGVYFSIMDVARFDMLVRNGVWKDMRDRGWYPVVASETITFRKSLNPWDRFTIESRIIGHDDKAVYMEQRFVRPSTSSGSGASSGTGGASGTGDGSLTGDAAGAPQIYATGYIRARFLRKAGGTVPMAEVVEAFGVDGFDGIPEWLERWGADVALPAARAEAPSVWH